MPTTDPCPPLSDLQKLVADLTTKSKQQNAADAKTSLVGATTVASDVQKAEDGYKKDYDGLSLAVADATQYESAREARASALLQPGEGAQALSIVDGVDTAIACNLALSTKAAKALQDAQNGNATAQSAVATAEPPYRAALAYNANFTDLAAVQARAGKEYDGANYRGAYVLLREMKKKLQNPQLLPTVDGYNKDLETKAVAYFNAADAARQAKATLDQATADAQSAKKQYDDSVAKRLDTILKAVADMKYAPPPAAGPAAPVVAAPAVAPAVAPPPGS